MVTQSLQVRLDVFAASLWIFFFISCHYNNEKMKKLILIKKMPKWKASYGKEKVSDLFIVVTTADKNLIYKNTANTSSLTWRGCVMIFEPETSLYVSSTLNLRSIKKIFGFFQNGGFFPIAYFFQTGFEFFLSESSSD